MKTKLIFTLLVSLLAFSGCSEKETVSGDMPYHKEYKMTAISSVTSSGSNCRALLTTVQNGVKNLNLNYSKAWKVSFSGSSKDSALAKADREAVADFDAAVESLLDWHRQFEETKAKSDIGKGYFSVTYVVSVWRDKVLKESEPIVFEYEYKQ